MAFRRWSAAGLPVSTEVPTPIPACSPSTWRRQSDHRCAGDACGVSDPAIAKLDVRDVDEWIAESSSPTARISAAQGRIPGAKWLEWYRMMKPTAEGPRFKSSAEILAECRRSASVRKRRSISIASKASRLEHFPGAERGRVKDVGCISARGMSGRVTRLPIKRPSGRFRQLRGRTIMLDTACDSGPQPGFTHLRHDRLSCIAARKARA